MAIYIRVVDELGFISVDRNRFAYDTVTASQYSPPSNSIQIADRVTGQIQLRGEWDTFRDDAGNTFGADLASSVIAINAVLVGPSPASGVTDVTATAPVTSTGGTTPDIGITASTPSADGSMSAADKTKLDGIASGAEVNVNADWNATSGDEEILNKPTVPTQLSDLSDVNTGSPSSPNTLIYDGVGEFRAGNLDLGDLANVDGTTPTNNDVLTYDSGTSQWRPAAGGGGGGGSNFISHAYAFFDSSHRDVYIPITTEGESTSRQRYNRWVAPCDGSVKSISWYGTTNLTATGAPTKVEVYKMTGSTTFVVIGTANFTSITGYVGQVSNFSTNTFSAGDTLYFFLTNNFGTTPVYNVSGNILFDVT